MLIPKLREDAEEIINTFIRSKIAEAKASGVAIGLSGGLDSTLVAHLCTRALGKERVLGVMMPEKGSDPKDLEHGLLVAKGLGIEHMVVDISGPVQSFQEILPKLTTQLTTANVKARCRMVVLYMTANSTGRLVMGCGNKTELMVGYFTKFGDGGVDYMPIGDLYKTQVRELAARIGVDPEILQKSPSAGLWEGQTDEDEMGVTYANLDQILYGLETDLPPARIAAEVGCDVSKAAEIEGKMRATVHKRRLPQIPKIGFKTPGFDWREF
ncbi:MAG TPA: NAD+ synthase [Thermoplasmata archaeon]|nr:NAD+ synthase [Thermoplasmata archaeon]